MLKVTVELVPFGVKGKTKKLVEAHIINDGTGTASMGNYKVKLFDKRGRPWREGKVEKHRRKDLHVWYLIYKAIGSVFGG